MGTFVSAVMASSCCWLPPLLLVCGVSGAGMIATLEAYRPVFMVVTFGFLGAAFYFTYRPRRAPVGTDPASDCCSSSPKEAGTETSRRRFDMMAMNKIMLWAVTAMAVVFLFFPGAVTGLFKPSDAMSADMVQTVIQVEGMTCPG
ncbi:MAG: mercuric transporter MerT family protein [Planctomycetales bacterium]